MIALAPIFLLGIFAFCVISRIERHAETLRNSKEEK